MSLPAAWVDKLFERLARIYGQGFLRQYDGVPLEGVKETWADELSVFQQNPDAIRYGLEHLPADRAPTVLQFRDLCRKRPEAEPIKALPAPTPDPAVAAAVREAFTPKTGRDPKQWARDLKEREERGTGLALFQRKAWREALGEQA